MKIVNKTIKIHTSKLYDFIELKDIINNVVKESKITDGFCLIKISHTTVALIVTEKDSAVH